MDSTQFKHISLQHLGLTRRCHFRNELLARCMLLCLFLCGKSMWGRSHYELREPMRSGEEQETGSQMIMQRWFFTSKRTCPSLSPQKKLNSETTPLHADWSLRFCLIQIWTLCNRLINVVSVWKRQCKIVNWYFVWLKCGNSEDFTENVYFSFIIICCNKQRRK